MSTELWTNALFFAGRLLLGGLFVYGGIRHFFILGPVSDAIKARGVPLPRLVLIVGSLFEAVCGLLLIANLYVMYAALGLALFTVLATLMLLNFWDMTGPERDAAKNNVTLNAAIVGG